MDLPYIRNVNRGLASAFRVYWGFCLFFQIFPPFPDERADGVDFYAVIAERRVSYGALNGGCTPQKTWAPLPKPRADPRRYCRSIFRTCELISRLLIANLAYKSTELILCRGDAVWLDRPLCGKGEKTRPRIIGRGIRQATLFQSEV